MRPQWKTTIEKLERNIHRSLMLAALAVAAFGITQPASADDFSDILSRGTLRIGVGSDQPPFGQLNAKHELEGFDIDLCSGLAEAIGVKPELVVVTSPNRIPYMLTKKVDVLCSFLGINAERARQILYSQPYAMTALAVYGPAALKVKEPTETGANKVAAAKGGIQELTMMQLNPKADILHTDSDATALTAYLSGQAALLATNTLMAQEFKKSYPNKEFDLKFYLRKAPAHIGVRMGEHNLLHFVDTYLYLKTLDGTLDRLSRKWLGYPLEPLPSL